MWWLLVEVGAIHIAKRQHDLTKGVGSKQAFFLVLLGTTVYVAHTFRFVNGKGGG